MTRFLTTKLLFTSVLFVSACSGPTPANQAKTPLQTVAECTAIELAQEQELPFHVIADESHVYWSNVASNRVMRANPLSGQVEVVATDQWGVTGIAVDATHVYWTNNHANEVVRINKTGGPLQILAHSQEPFSLIVDGTYVYWSTYDQGAIYRIPKTGGVASKLATSGSDGFTEIASDSTHLYWTQLASGTVMKVTKSGGPTKVIARGQMGPTNIVVDASRIYWINSALDTAMAVTKSGGLPETFAQASELAVLGSELYWSNSTDNSLRKLEGRNGAKHILTGQQKGLGEGLGLVASSSHIYWSTLRHGTIHALNTRCSPIAPTVIAGT